MVTQTESLRKTGIGLFLTVGIWASAPAADSIVLRTNKPEYLVGEPILCHVRLSSPSPQRPIRKVRLEHRILNERGEEEAGWSEAQAAPLKENRRELMFSLWCEGGGGQVVTARPGKFALLARGTWYERLEEHPFVVSDPIAFEVREVPEDRVSALELMELARACSRRYPSGRELRRVRAYASRARAVYKPYAGWLLARLYHDERDPRFVGGRAEVLFGRAYPGLGPDGYADLELAEEAMAGFRADFPTELDERRRTLEVARAYRSGDKALFRRLFSEYAAKYQFAGRLDLGSLEVYAREPSGVFMTRAREAAESPEASSDPRKRLEQALGRMWAANDPTGDTLIDFLASDAPARRAAMELVRDELLPPDPKWRLIRALAKISFPERDEFVKDCATGKYGDEFLRPAGIAVLKHIRRDFAEVAILENLERILDDPPPSRDLKHGGQGRNSWPAIDMAVELRIFRAKDLLKALSDEGVPKAREALKKLEELERAGK